MQLTEVIEQENYATFCQQQARFSSEYIKFFTKLSDDLIKAHKKRNEKEESKLPTETEEITNNLSELKPKLKNESPPIKDKTPISTVTTLITNTKKPLDPAMPSNFLTTLQLAETAGLSVEDKNNLIQLQNLLAQAQWVQSKPETRFDAAAEALAKLPASIRLNLHKYSSVVNAEHLRPAMMSRKFKEMRLYGEVREITVAVSQTNATADKRTLKPRSRS